MSIYQVCFINQCDERSPQRSRIVVPTKDPYKDQEGWNYEQQKEPQHKSCDNTRIAITSSIEVNVKTTDLVKLDHKYDQDCKTQNSVQSTQSTSKFTRYRLTIVLA